jgi:hypothetical protein
MCIPALQCFQSNEIYVRGVLADITCAGVHSARSGMSVGSRPYENNQGVTPK